MKNFWVFLNQFWPMILVFGAPAIGAIIKRVSEQSERRKQEALRLERERELIRMGKDPGSIQSDSPQKPMVKPRVRASSQTSMSDELARRRQAALDELRRRQQARLRGQQTAGRQGQSNFRSAASAPAPSRQSPVQRGTPVPPPHRRSSIPQGNIPQPHKTRKVRTDRHKTRTTPKPGIQAQPLQQGRGLDVDLQTVDQHYVRKEKHVWVQELQFDRDSIQKALLMAEILGPPLALRDDIEARINEPLAYAGFY